MSELWNSLKAFCCCTSTQTEDGENLIDNEEDSTSNGRFTNGFVGGYASPGNLRGGMDNTMSSSGEQQATRTQSQVEEDALNKILDRTQQSIIDVGNLNNLNGMDVDVAHRNRMYLEAIKHHDFQLDKAAPNAGTAALLHDTALSAMCILENVNPMRLNESLSESSSSKASKEELDFVSHIGDVLNDALAEEAQVNVKEDMVVYMTSDD